ncbi:MAG: hypothetical protein KDC72_09505, partial [Bacteroidetes bacterium]|nr:hypothetical protein [Bacteroidota bacterium]
MNKINQFLFLLTLCFSFNAWAQNEKPLQTPDNSDFIGLVQFIKGQVEWEKRPNRDKNEKILFKSFLHLSDVISISPKSYIKIISFQRCVGVVYGPAKLIMPVEVDRPRWYVEGGSARWICPDDQTQKVFFDGYEFDITQGEVFYYRNKLLVKKAQVSTQNVELKINTLYELKNKLWQPQKNKSIEVWNFEQKRPRPKESLVMNKPEKLKPHHDKSRWLFSHTESLEWSMSHSEKTLEMDTGPVDFEGESLMFHWELKNDKSLIGLLRYSETNNRNGNNFCNYDPVTDTEICPPDFDPNASNNLELLGADIGLRSRHKRNWSTYYLLGLHEVSYGIHSQFINENVFLNRKEKYLGLSVSLGIDYLLEFGGWFDWLGLYFSLEGRAIRTISHTGTEFES